MSLLERLGKYLHMSIVETLQIRLQKNIHTCTMPRLKQQKTRRDWLVFTECLNYTEIPMDTCTMKPLSKLLTHSLQLIFKLLRILQRYIKKNWDKLLWVINNSIEVTNTLDKLRHARPLIHFILTSLSQENMESHDSCSYLDLNIKVLNGEFCTDFL